MILVFMSAFILSASSHAAEQASVEEAPPAAPDSKAIECSKLASRISNDENDKMGKSVKRDTAKARCVRETQDISFQDCATIADSIETDRLRDPITFNCIQKTRTADECAKLVALLKPHRQDKGAELCFKQYESKLSFSGCIDFADTFKFPDHSNRMRLHCLKKSQSPESCIKDIVEKMDPNMKSSAQKQCAEMWERRRSR